MSGERQNVLPQASKTQKSNLAADSDRVKAPVVGAGPKDSGGGQTHPIAEKTERGIVSQWQSWKEIQDLEFSDQKCLERMKKVVQSMIDASKQQKNMSMTVKDGLAVLVEVYDILHGNDKKRFTLKNTLKTEIENSLRWSPSKERKYNARKVQNSSNSSDEESDISDTSAISAATNRDSRRPTSAVTSDCSNTHQWLIKKGAKDKISKQKNKDRNIEKEAKKRDYEQAKKKKENEKQEKQRKRKRKPGTNRKKPDALVIRVSETLTYSDVLKKLREKVKPEDTETEIRSIRKTMRGDVLLEIGGNSEVSEEFQATIKNAIGEPEAVMNLTPRSSIEIRDLDDLVTEVEVRKALEEKLVEKGGDLKIVITKANARSQRMAFVEMPTKAANLLVDHGRVRIGCVNCRIRHRVQVIKCFKCLGYGHRARECRNTNRTNNCYRCGEEGHKGATCQQAERCVLCTELRVKADHTPGRKGCTAFRQALEEAKKRTQ